MSKPLMERKIDEREFEGYEKMVCGYERFIRVYKRAYTILAKDIHLPTHNL